MRVKTYPNEAMFFQEFKITGCNIQSVLTALHVFLIKHTLCILGRKQYRLFPKRIAQTSRHAMRSHKVIPTDMMFEMT